MDSTTKAVISGELSEEDAARVIAALEAVTTDPGVGTVLRNPATGDTAVYVRQYNETYWRVRTTDDRTWTEFEPIVGWDVLYTTEVITTDAPGQGGNNEVTGNNGGKGKAK